MDPGALIRCRGSGAAAALALTVALLVGCGPGNAGADPQFRPAECPDRIVAEVLTPVTCGWVDVPERHDDPSGPRIALFVARILPGTHVSGEPAVWLGYDIGGTVEYGSMATLAPRIHREVIILDARGTGFSRPHLGCPEVAAVAPEIIALPSAATAGRLTYRTAVRACRDRLTEAGVDIAAYGLDEIVGDVRDVMTALGVGTVGLWTAGTSSRLLAPLIAGADEDVFRLAVIDNGSLTSLPGERFAATALEEALTAADALCDASCARTGAPAARLAELAAQLDDSPLETATADGTPLVLDGARLRGIAAWWLERHVGGAPLAAELAHAASGRAAAGPLESAERVMCLGQRPKCAAPDFSYGVWWTVRCQEPEFATQPSEERLCGAWDVAPPQHPAPRPVSAVPVLALYGALDPYLPSSERELTGLRRHTVVVDPSRGADVMIGCLRPWRNRWVDDVRLDPVDLCPGVSPPVTGIRTWDE